MPVIAANLLAPTGEVDPSYFPQDTAAELTTRLDAYIADANARVAAWTAENTGHTLKTDAAVQAWAYHRAFKQVHMDLSIDPARADFTGQGGRTYLLEQINTFRRNAEHWLHEYQAALSAGLPASTKAVPTGSQSVETRFHF